MMTLLEWMKINTITDDRPDNYDDIIDDILAQLLGFICRRNDSYNLLPGSTSSAAESLSYLLFLTGCEDTSLRINPENFEIQNEESGFVKLNFLGSNSSNRYSDTLCNSGLLSCNEESDNVLAAGIIYAELCFGETFDYQGVIDLDTGDNLLRKMIVTDPSRRITARDALEQLSNRKRSYVTINYVESDSRTVVKHVDKSFEGASMTLSRLENSINDDNGHILYLSDTRTRRLNYRVAHSSEIVFCSPWKKSEINRINYERPYRIMWVGLDIGLRQINVSEIDNRGIVSDIFSSNPVGIEIAYPSVVAFNDNKKLYFGNEAVQIRNKYKVETANIFEYNLQDTIVFESKSGERLEISPDNLLLQFFAELKKNILHRTKPGFESLSFVYTLPDELVDSKKNVIRRALEQSGFGNAEISGAQAVSCWLTKSGAVKHENPVIMVIDAAKGATRISVVKSTQQCDSEIECKRNESGGDDITNILLEKAEYQIMFDIPNYRNISNNTERLKSCVEKLKKSLSFSNRSQCEVLLCCESGEEKKLRIILERSSFCEKFQEIKRSISCCIDSFKYSEIKISNLVILGGASVMPDLRECAVQCAKEIGCEISILEYKEAVARGAAVYGCLLQTSPDQSDKLKKVQCESHDSTTREIGIQIKDPLHFNFVFQTKIPIGTNFDNNGQVNFEYEYKVIDEEFRKKKCSLILYTREKGMSHITSTFDDECEAIRAMGKLVIDIPDKFNLRKDYFVINIYVDREEKVTAQIIWKHKVLGIINVDSNLVNYEFISAK